MVAETLSRINSTLNNFVKSANFSRVEESISVTVEGLRTIDTTAIGNAIEEQVNGIKVLTEGRGNLSLSIITPNVPAIQQKIIKDVSAAKADLEALTGGTIDNAFLDITIAVPTPAGLNKALNEIVDVLETDEFELIMNNIVPDELAKNLKDVFNQDFVSITANLKSSVATFTASINNLIENGSGNPILDVVLKTDQSLLGKIAALGVSFSVAQGVVKLLRVGNIIAAADIINEELKNFSDEGLPLSLEEVKDLLTEIDVSISGQVKDTGISSVSQVYDTQSSTNKWNGAKTKTNLFTRVCTFEELSIEFVKAKREITQLVFVGWETDDDHRIDAQMLHDIQVKNGEDGINEHYVLRQNGSVQRGRPIDKLSDFSETHKDYTILIAVPYSGSSINMEQSKSIELIIKAFYNSWPGGQVFDAKELDGEFTYPGFDVDAHVKLNGKTNYGSIKASSSTNQLIKSAQLYHQAVAEYEKTADVVT